MFFDGRTIRNYVPQRLKPLLREAVCGTAEAKMIAGRDVRARQCDAMRGEGGESSARTKTVNCESTPRSGWDSWQSGVKPPHSTNALLARARRTRRGWAAGGFTLIELMIVITIMLILIGMAAVRYDRSVEHAKEAALHHDLSVMRQAIEQYTLDKEQAPQSLDDLVSAGYLRAIPNDPVTGAKDWVTDSSDAILSPDQSSGGISDVHSGSGVVSPFENTPYNTW